MLQHAIGQKKYISWNLHIRNGESFTAHCILQYSVDVECPKPMQSSIVDNARVTKDWLRRRGGYLLLFQCPTNALQNNNPMILIHI